MPPRNPLPKDITRKIYKTGQTRGAEDDEIFQNRVGRNSTVLIPFHEYECCAKAPTFNGKYENGFIVLIKPEDYFDKEIQNRLKSKRLVLGENLLVFYETRCQWDNYPPLNNWTIPNSRTKPLGGQYVARVPATTSEGVIQEFHGYNISSLKGAGIRVYEYADSTTIQNCRIQLEYIFWQCSDIEGFINESNDSTAMMARKNYIERVALEQKLADTNKLIHARILNKKGHAICPFCLRELSSKVFGEKLQLAEGRDVPDTTVTDVSLFHIKELRTGQFNHKPYNLGWGHHYCNVVVKDAGIEQTLKWIREVLADNDAYSLE